MNQRNKENLQNEADQQVRSYSYNKQSMHSEKTKRYTFNEKGEIIDINKRFIVPQLKVKEILIENHDHLLTGHLGIAKTIARIKRHYIWKGLKKDVVAHVTSSILCARRKAIGATKAPLQPLSPVYSTHTKFGNTASVFPGFNTAAYGPTCLQFFRDNSC